MAAYSALSFVLCVVAALTMTENISSATVLRLGDLDTRTNCLINPCEVTQCYAFPGARCTADYAEGCNAKFYLGRRAIAPAECGSIRPSGGGRILRDDTENEGSSRNDPGSPINRPRTRSSSPSNSGRRRPSGSSSSGSRVSNRTQQILDRKRQAEAQRARQMLENEIRLRRQQNARSSSSSSRSRSSSRPRSRGSPGRRNKNSGWNSNSRSRSSQRSRSSGGFFSRLFRG